jgi:hypothetical protein
LTIIIILLNWKTPLLETEQIRNITLWLNRKEVAKDLQKNELKEEIVACQKRKVCNALEGQKMIRYFHQQYTSEIVEV